MMTNKLSLISCALLIAAGVVTSAWAADSTVINIKANIVASPCTVATDKLDIDLGDIQSVVLAKAEDASPWSAVQNIQLTNCPAGTSTVTATFNGTPGVNFVSYKNTGTANNVGIELADDNSTINYLSNGTTKAVTVASGSANIPVRARLQSDGAATVGTVLASVNVTFEYK
jgi:minor fimbrial subunit